MTKEIKLKNKSDSKKYIALISTKVFCNKIYELVEGEEIPKDFPKPFIESLITNKTIKEVQ
jgi:hypothetical protein